ncbi:hypothetical protein CEN39_14975, partial [Fischerella thermalis CCMEE 5201]
FEYRKIIFSYILQLLVLLRYTLAIHKCYLGVKILLFIQKIQNLTKTASESIFHGYPPFGRL